MYNEYIHFSSQNYPWMNFITWYCMGGLRESCNYHIDLWHPLQFFLVKIIGTVSPVYLHYISSRYLRVCVCSVTQPCPTLCDIVEYNSSASLSMGFPRQEYWSGLPFPPPGHLPNPGMEPPGSHTQVYISSENHSHKTIQLSGFYLHAESVQNLCRLQPSLSHY